MSLVVHAVALAALLAAGPGVDAEAAGHHDGRVGVERVLPPHAEGAVRRLIRRAEPQTVTVERIVVERTEVVLHLGLPDPSTEPGVLERVKVRLVSRSDVQPAADPRSFRVAGAPGTLSDPRLKPFLDRLRAADAQALPWQVVEPTSAASPDPVPDVSVAEGAAPAVVRPVYLPEEAPWRRALRELGPVGWGLALLLLAGGVAWALSRRGDKGHGATVRAGQLLALGASSLLAGWAMSGVVGVMWPAPAPVRGHPPRSATPPAPGALAIYAWGDSTMAGEPYFGQFTLASLVAERLAPVAGRPVHMDFLGAPGLSLNHGDLTGLREVLERPQVFRPAAVVLYVGHNEFSGVVAPDGLEPAALAVRRGEAEAGYARELQRLAAACDRVGAALVLTLPVANIDHHPPLRSVHARTLSPQARAEAERALGEAAVALEEAAGHRALAAAARALELSPGMARAHHLRARALALLGRSEEAAQAAWKAVAYDAGGNRATPAMRRAGQAVCDDGLATCVDPEPALRRRLGGLGDAQFVDLHHPDRRTYRALADAISSALASALELRSPADSVLELEPLSGRAPFDVALHGAQWYLTLLESEPGALDAATRVDALARAEAALEAADEARAPTVADAAELRWLQGWSAWHRGDEELARRHLARALAPPRSEAMRLRAESPRHRERLTQLGVALAGD